MDGINPTLAFAVLFFGLSGNAREAPNDPATEAKLADEAGCPALTISVDPPQPPAIETWAEAFWDSADDTSRLPRVIEPKWSNAAPPETDGSEVTSDVAAVALASGADPIMRQTVPTGLNGPAADADLDPCAQDR